MTAPIFQPPNIEAVGPELSPRLPPRRLTCQEFLQLAGLSGTIPLLKDWCLM